MNRKVKKNIHRDIWFTPDAHLGHSHGGTNDYGKSTDVGVDCWNYSPVHIDVIVKHVENKNLISHHK